MSDAPAAPLRVLIVDDEPLARLRLRGLVEANALPAAQVVGEAGDAPQAQALLAHTPCDLVLLDIVMPGGSGLKLADGLRRPVQVLTAAEFATFHERALAGQYELFVTVPNLGALAVVLGAASAAGALLRALGSVRRLRANGHDVNVWNRSAAKARALEADGWNSHFRVATAVESVVLSRSFAFGLRGDQTRVSVWFGQPNDMRVDLGTPSRPIQHGSRSFLGYALRYLRQRPID